MAAGSAAAARAPEGKSGCWLCYRCLVDGCVHKYAGRFNDFRIMNGDAAEARKLINQALESGEAHRIEQAQAVQKAVVWREGDEPEEPLTCKRVHRLSCRCSRVSRPAAAARCGPQHATRFSSSTDCRFFTSDITWWGTTTGRITSANSRST